MKILRDSGWYKQLIQKLDHGVYTNPELYAKMDELDSELGIPSNPTCHSTAASRLVNLGILEAVPDDARKGRGREKPMIFSVVSTEDLDKKLVRKSSGRKKATKSATKVYDIVETPKPTIAKEKEDAFIKYFRCLRTCVRKRDGILTLNECKEVNNKPGKESRLVRINSKHVCYWAKMVQKLGAPVDMPVIHKEKSGGVKIEFRDYEENLIIVCDKGVKLFGYQWLDPSEAFGKNSETRIRRARYNLDKKNLGQEEEITEESVIQVEKPNRPIEFNEYQKRIIFMVGGYLCEVGGRQSFSKITDFLLDQKVINVTDNLEDILNECPELVVKSGVLNEDIVKVVSFQETDLEEDNLKAFWKNYCDLYGPDFNEKEEILCRISMTNEEVSEILSSNTAEVETASQISEHDGIYRIVVSKNSAVDRMNMIDLVQKFRKGDVVLSHSNYTKELLDSVANFKKGDAFYRFERLFE